MNLITERLQKNVVLEQNTSKLSFLGRNMYNESLKALTTFVSGLITLKSKACDMTRQNHNDASSYSGITPCVYILHQCFIVYGEKGSLLQHKGST
jgi:hypothetical protein